MAKLEHTHSNVLRDLQEAQNADHDRREMAREADHFVNKHDGQWEPEIIQMYKGKPRYTIDLTSSIIADVHGEMSSMDFAINVKPGNGPSTTPMALHMAGLIRNIENNSGDGAKYIYRAAGKQMLTSGIGGWEVASGYRDPMSFDQDLMVKPISNFMDRVWLDPGSELQNGSDANWGFKLTSMSKAKYKKDFPKGGGMSIGRDLSGNVYSYKKSDAVVVGAHYYKKYETVELVRMTNGSVFVNDEKFKKVKKELALENITIDKTRKSKLPRVHQRMLDGQDFLTSSEETVFSYLPLIPLYGNFEISEDKLIYWGLVEKHMDPQRILNYVESRKVSEGALAPRAKKWMTSQQAAGYTDELASMNTNNDPIQFYNHVETQPQPFETGGAQINPGLSETSADMKAYMQSISGRLDPARSEPLGLQSGLALQELTNKSDVANFGYFTALEVAISHTCRVIGEAIPRVYDALREVQIDEHDGTTQTITINKPVMDQETQKIVNLNDLSKGTYSYTCSAGPSFHNRQQETVTAMNEIAAIDPSIMQTGADIYLSNIPSPGMDKLAKRKRAQMIEQGMIPPEEFTTEEQQVAAQKAQQGPPPPSPLEQAQIAIAESEREKAEAGTADIISKIDERDKKFKLEVEKMMLAKSKQEDERFVRIMESQNNEIKVMADTLNVIREAMGVESIVGPHNTVAYTQQAGKLLEAVKGQL